MAGINIPPMLPLLPLPLLPALPPSVPHTQAPLPQRPALPPPAPDSKFPLTVVLDVKTQAHPLQGQSQSHSQSTSPEPRVKLEFPPSEVSVLTSESSLTASEKLWVRELSRRLKLTLQFAYPMSYAEVRRVVIFAMVHGFLSDPQSSGSLGVFRDIDFFVLKYTYMRWQVPHLIDQMETLWETHKSEDTTLRKFVALPHHIAAFPFNVKMANLMVKHLMSTNPRSSEHHVLSTVSPLLWYLYRSVRSGSVALWEMIFQHLIPRLTRAPLTPVNSGVNSEGQEQAVVTTTTQQLVHVREEWIIFRFLTHFGVWQGTHWYDDKSDNDAAKIVCEAGMEGMEVSERGQRQDASIAWATRHISEYKTFVAISRKQAKA